LAMKSKPRLRILRLDEGERLDSESWSTLLRLASERGFQVWATAVRDESALKVEIIDAECAEHAESAVA